MPQLYMIIPVGGLDGNRPDNTLPVPPGPVDPGYSPPWARPGGGPVDPGYSPPWARPGGGPVDPGFGNPWFDPHPDQGLPGSQPRPWGPNDPRPTPPIYIGPPVKPPEPPPEIVWHAAWTPTHGWMTVGIPTGPTPTPSE